ncbi:hypothetical protein GCM10029978_116570 [Actinoallomurus acanthiterrae]
MHDVAAEHEDTVVFGVLAGKFPDGAHPAELHDAGRITLLRAVTLECPPDDGSDEAFLRFVGEPAHHFRARTVLYPALCGERVH